MEILPVALRITALFGLAACAAAPTVDGPPLAIPSHAADDPRPGEPGFVRGVRLVEIGRGETTFVLMAFEVGSELTLGAMVQGAFTGDVRWRLGDATLSFAFGDEAADGGVPVDVHGGPAGAPAPVGEQAAFGGFRWVNIVLDSAAWLPHRKGALSLRFTGRDGVAVQMPSHGTYAARLVRRS